MDLHRRPGDRHRRRDLERRAGRRYGLIEAEADATSRQRRPARRSTVSRARASVRTPLSATPIRGVFPPRRNRMVRTRLAVS
jgi:hypothetical protein